MFRVLIIEKINNCLNKKNVAVFYLKHRHASA